MTENQFVTVPARTLPDGSHVPSFEVGKYACAKGPSGGAIVSATEQPWVSTTYSEACQACTDAGFTLTTERQWLSLAQNIAEQAVNWTGGTVGVGALYQGLRKGTVSQAQAGDFVSPDGDERRWFALSNGERIYDIAGNVFQYVFDDVQGSLDGRVEKPFAQDSVSLMAPCPSREKGMGWRPSFGLNWSSYALVRGGYWNVGDDAGVFYLNGGWPDSGNGNVGFRCTR